MGKYKLECLSCGAKLVDNYTSQCTCGGGGFLRSVYRQKSFNPSSDNSLWRFCDWLPVEQPPKGHKKGLGKTIVYQSIRLAKELGLKNLYIAFNGYWPEKGATILTGTFKGLEAPPTIKRATEKGLNRLLLATAGNTGRAFAEETINQRFEVIIVAAISAQERLWTTVELSGKNVKFIALGEGNDYTNAIELGRRICSEINIETEGGARNVARRDGMGTCLLEAVSEIGSLPQHYFQAIGSGTGGIAAWEASIRIIEDGRFGHILPKLHLAQNKDFAPIVNAWNAKRSIITKEDLTLPPEQMANLYAEVLANRKPPYSIAGGVYYALTATKGEMYAVTKEEAIAARKLFSSTEEIDIVPPAAVAVGALVKAVAKEKISPNEIVLLNITGGGLERIKEDYNLIPIKPTVELKSTADSLAEIKELLVK